MKGIGIGPMAWIYVIGLGLLLTGTWVAMRVQDECAGTTTFVGVVLFALVLGFCQSVWLNIKLGPKRRLKRLGLVGASIGVSGYLIFYFGLRE